MSHSEYLKCHCQHCGQPIEYPAESAGLEAGCPHCGQSTLLSPPVAETPFNDPQPDSATASGPAGGRKAVWLALAGTLVIGAGVAAFFMLGGSRPAPEPTGTTQDRSSAPFVEDTNTTAVPVDDAKAAKSIDDFKVGAITLEKTKGSSLVYAVGTLKNNSPHQRFGVTIEIELADAQGRPAGKAKDYRPVLEPRQEWRFRALVLDAKAVSARLSAIRETE